MEIRQPVSTLEVELALVVQETGSLPDESQRVAAATRKECEKIERMKKKANGTAATLKHQSPRKLFYPFVVSWGEYLDDGSETWLL